MRDENKDSLIEFVLRNAEPIAARVKEAQAEKSGRSSDGDNNTGGSRGSHISDPTAAQALKLVEPVQFIYCPYGPVIKGRREERYIRLPEKWLKVEKATREFYTKDSAAEKVREIYKRRYLQGEYGERWEITCAKLSIGHGWYYSVVHDIVRFAGLYASGLGLIAPYSRF